ncbi:MAG TPA: hypothetical protein VLZ28_04480 [Daejeonella sp.]|nr:hypothetical protein [Daejeonella sp.]
MSSFDQQAVSTLLVYSEYMLIYGESPCLRNFSSARLLIKAAMEVPQTFSVSFSVV